MFVYVSMCMYVHVSRNSVYTCPHTSVYVCMYVRMCMSRGTVCILIHLCMHVCMNACVYVFVDVRQHVYACL